MKARRRPSRAAPSSQEQPAVKPEGKELSELAALLQQNSPETLTRAASDLRLTEDLSLALLKRLDLPSQAIERLSKNKSAMKHRRVINALVAHPRTPRHVALPVIRRLFSFELMCLALLPGLAADLKVAAEEAIISRLDTISEGERLTLAKRGSRRIAAALLLDRERRVIECALANPFMTEAGVVKALMNDKSTESLIACLCQHAKWGLRQEVRIALLRNEKTPMARAIALSQSMPSAALRQVLRDSRLAENIKQYLERLLDERPASARASKAGNELS